MDDSGNSGTVNSPGSTPATSASPTSTPVPTTFTDTAFDVPIEGLALQQRKARLTLSKQYAAIGVKTIKAKVSMMAILGKHAERVGLKALGHGHYVAAGDNAAMSIEELDSIIQEERNKPECNTELIIALLQLKQQFNRQLMEAGEMHLRSDKHLNGSAKDDKIQLPFPAGKPMTVVVTNHTPKLPEPIEDAKPAS